jgi:hypothetical protein
MTARAMNLSRCLSFLFFGIFIWMVGCATNPVEGWALLFSSPNHMGAVIPGEPLHHQYKAMIDDYQAYLENAKLKHPDWSVHEVRIYEHSSGQHAVKLIFHSGYQEYKDFYLMYDKSDVRTRVIKGKTRVLFHI